MTVALLAASSLFAANFALGVSLQLGSRWHPRPLHHVLYFLTAACILLAAVLAAREGRAWAWPALIFAALLLMPRTKPGRPDHALLACLIGAGLIVTSWSL
mgnify:CR=1 FL=1